MPSDEELMAAVALGDLAAFNEIVLRHQDSAWKVAYHFIGNAAEAEDISQEAFLRIFDAASRYKPTASFRTYLFRILNRICLDHIRKKRPIPTDEIREDADPRPSPEERVIQDERDTAVQEAVDTLPSIREWPSFCAISRD